MLFYVSCEYDCVGIDEMAGTGFGIIAIHDANGTDYTFLVDRKARFLNFDGARYHIAAELGVDPDEIDLEEI